MKGIYQFFFFLFVASCSNSSKPDKLPPAGDSFLPTTGAYEHSECTTYSGDMNTLYLTPFYYPAFHSDMTQYLTIIIGDSTMDASVRYPGFKAPTTGSTAVAGNTLCDMLIQLPAINTTDPANIILSTDGGNDLIRQTDKDQIVHTGELIITRLLQKYPTSNLIIVAIHPSLVDYANREKGYINSWIMNKLQTIYPVSQQCWVDPQFLFSGVTREGDPAQASDMLDTIHYNKAMSFQIKAKIQDDCGILF